MSFIIVKLNNGPQLIPESWYNEYNESCIWPGHYKGTNRINKAIMTKEMPQNNLEWDELPVQRIFSKADSYEEGIEKLVLAEDKLHIDTSSDELHEQNKKRKRMETEEMWLTSSDESEDDCVISNKSLPDCSEIRNFVPSNQLHINKSHNPTSKNTVYKWSDVELKKSVVEKLNNVIYKLDTIENRINIVENKMQPSNFANRRSDIQFPITTLKKLTHFEQQLRNKKQFKTAVVNIFQGIGGNNMRMMTRNILKKAITDTVAQNFSWTGNKSKRSFRNLGLAQIIIQTVQKTFGDVTDNDIETYISKWLDKVTSRVEITKYSYSSGEESI